jgi:hypothetical protein
MAKIQLGEWLPDQPGVTGALTDAVNCYPVANGYAPFKSETNYSNDAAADLLTVFAGKYATTVGLFAGSGSNLYKYNSGTKNMDSANTTGYTSIEYWDNTQFGSKVICANGVNRLQSFTLNSSTYFANLSSDAPQAKYVSTIRDFVVAANVSGFENKVYWSDINNETNWTPGATSQADSQVMPDGGDITGLAGGEFGIVFLERAIYRMSYCGSPLFFQFDAINTKLGCIAAGSIAQFAGLTYFLGTDGFYVCNGQDTKSISENKVSKWFFSNATLENINNTMSSAVDPINKLIVWCFKTQSGANYLLTYSITLNKFTYCQTTASSVASALTPSVSLDDLDGYSSSIDALTVSLDDRQWSGKQLIFAGTSGKKAITFGGANKTASIVTGDINAGRTVINLVRPTVDGGSGSVQIASRTQLSDSLVFGDVSVADSEGRCSVRAAGYYHRIKLIPTGNWVTAVGLDANVISQGSR